MTCAYFVSDLHLSGVAEDRNHEIFHAFLKALRQPHMPTNKFAKIKKPTHLFLVGDIFDLWVGSHVYFQRKFADIVTEIRGLISDGVEIHYFEGNHDFHLRTYWQDEIGVQVHTDFAYFDLANRVVRVEHGDLINPEDHGYLFLRWFFRTSLMKQLAVHLPSGVVRRVGEKASHKSRSYNLKEQDFSQDKIRQMIHVYAHKVYNERRFDLLITGHVHVNDDYSFFTQEHPESLVRSVNLGSWSDGARVFMLTDTTTELVALHGIAK